MPKPKEIELKRPLRVIQVYRNACLFQKGDLALGQNRDFLRWPEKSSSTGFVSNGVLRLMQPFEELTRINQYDLVLLFDDFSDDPDRRERSWLEKPCVFKQAASQINLRFLRLKPKEERFEIFLSGSDLSGWPKRESRKLCELQTGSPVGIKINGKMDGYHQRYYIEEQFVLEDLGKLQTIQIAPLQESVLKKVPEPVKRVDLRELLW